MRNLVANLFTSIILIASLLTFPLGAQVPTNGLVAYYPFNGNANDESGNGHDGIVYSAMLTTDRFLNQDSAYYFNGEDSYIDLGVVDSFSLSTFTISVWVNAYSFMYMYTRVLEYGEESYGLGNGFGIEFNSDIINDGNKTFYGVFYGQDDFTRVVPSCEIDTLRWYHIVFSYNMSDGLSQLYIDNQLEQSMYVLNEPATGKFYVGSWTGESAYFHGLIDDIRVYDKILSEEEISDLYHEGGWPGPSHINLDPDLENSVFIQNYPNPFNAKTRIDYKVKKAGKVEVSIFNYLGQKVASLVNEIKPVGNYSITWDAQEFPSGTYFYKIVTADGTLIKKMVLIK